MKRVVHVLLVHGRYQQTDRAHHHHGIAGLDGDDHIVERFPLTDAQELHTALHDALRSITITTHDAVGK